MRSALLPLVSSFFFKSLISISQSDEFLTALKKKKCISVFISHGPVGVFLGTVHTQTHAHTRTRTHTFSIKRKYLLRTRKK